MMTMRSAEGAIVAPLDPATRGLIVVAAQVFDASEDALAALMREAREAGTSARWLEELVLMTVLFAGFPKALVAAAALRKVEPKHGDVGDAADYHAWTDWRERGEETAHKVYGANYPKLRDNVKALHPALDAWIITDGYGRTISRPGLDLRRRELCAIAILVPQGVPRQLHSHLRGALNAGATEADVTETLRITGAAVNMPAGRAKAAVRLWADLRAGAE